MQDYLMESIDMLNILYHVSLKQVCSEFSGDL